MIGAFQAGAMVGETLGPELVTDWDFSTGAGWQSYNGASISDGKWRVTNAASGGQSWRGITLSPGTYVAKLVIESSNCIVQVFFGGSPYPTIITTVPNQIGIISGRVTISTDLTKLYIGAYSTSNTAVVDSLSLRKVI